MLRQCVLYVTLISLLALLSNNKLTIFDLAFINRTVVLKTG